MTILTRNAHTKMRRWNSGPFWLSVFRSRSVRSGRCGGGGRRVAFKRLGGGGGGGGGLSSSSTNDGVRCPPEESTESQGGEYVYNGAKGDVQPCA